MTLAERVTFQYMMISTRTALTALRRNLLRSLLTALGVIIGVAAVVAMVAVGNGAKASIESKVAALGQNLLTVYAGSRRSAGANAGQGTASTLTIADAVALGREIPQIQAVSPEEITSAQIIANGRNWSTSVVGEAPQYLGIRQWGLQAGFMFTDGDVRSVARVAVMGSKTARELFGPINPVGQLVRVKNIPFLVVGVLRSKGSGVGGQNQDDRLIIPYSTALQRLTGNRYLRSINIQVAEAAQMDGAQAQIRALLRQRHRLPAGAEDDFGIFNQKEIADTVTSVTSAVTLLLGAVAGMSLVVGGIGIMNIMLVSVTERTREIGLRIAIGAQPGDIRSQFLIEAITLSLLGGGIGIAIGLLVSIVVSKLLAFAALVSLSSIALAFGVSCAMGVFFGFYPAYRAAKLDPIDALRFE